MRFNLYLCRTAEEAIKNRNKNEQTEAMNLENKSLLESNTGEFVKSLDYRKIQTYLGVFYKNKKILKIDLHIYTITMFVHYHQV